jgi:hypothetical protein
MHKRLINTHAFILRGCPRKPDAGFTVDELRLSHTDEREITMKTGCMWGGERGCTMYDCTIKKSFCIGLQRGARGHDTVSHECRVENVEYEKIHTIYIEHGNWFIN